MKMFTTVCVAAVTLMATTASATVLDDFNRPDSSTLGPNWTQQEGSSYITNNQAGGTSGSEATFNGVTSNTISFDISDNGGLAYVAGVLGFGAGDQDFIKVQDNGGGQFDHYAFYTGNNGAGLFDSLSATFTQAHVTVSYSGPNATLTIDPLGGTEQVYTHTYGAAPGGSGIGLGFYGSATADNFSVTGGVPEPAAWALMLVGFGLVGAAARRKSLLPNAA